MGSIHDQRPPQTGSARYLVSHHATAVALELEPLGYVFHPYRQTTCQPQFLLSSSALLGCFSVQTPVVYFYLMTSFSFARPRRNWGDCKLSRATRMRRPSLGSTEIRFLRHQSVRYFAGRRLESGTTHWRVYVSHY